MTKKIVAIALVLIMAFACVIPAAAAISFNTANEAAVDGAKWKYLGIDGKSSDDADYAAFKVTRSVDNGDGTFTMTVRSNYVWKYTCTVQFQDLAGLVQGYTLKSGDTLEETNQIVGVIGYIVDTILETIESLLG